MSSLQILSVLSYRQKSCLNVTQKSTVFSSASRSSHITSGCWQENGVWEGVFVLVVVVVLCCSVLCVWLGGMLGFCVCFVLFLFFSLPLNCPGLLFVQTGNFMGKLQCCIEKKKKPTNGLEALAHSVLKPSDWLIKDLLLWGLHTSHPPFYILWRKIRISGEEPDIHLC